MIGADSEESERIRLGSDAGGQLLFVLAGGIVLAAAMRLAYDLPGEDVVGAGVLTSAEQFHRPVGPAGTDVTPVPDLVFGCGRPEFLQLFDGDVARPIIARVYDDRDRVHGQGTSR